MNEVLQPRCSQGSSLWLRARRSLLAEKTPRHLLRHMAGCGGGLTARDGEWSVQDGGFEGIWLMKRMDVSGWRGRLRSSWIGLEAGGNNAEWKLREGTMTWQCWGRHAASSWCKIEAHPVHTLLKLSESIWDPQINSSISLQSVKKMTTALIWNITAKLSTSAQNTGYSFTLHFFKPTKPQTTSHFQAPIWHFKGFWSTGVQHQYVATLHVLYNVLCMVGFYWVCFVIQACKKKQKAKEEQNKFKNKTILTQKQPTQHSPSSNKKYNTDCK